MNESNRAVREAARDLAVEILGAIGIQPQEMDLHFGEGEAGAAIELRLTRFAGVILEQAKASSGQANPQPPIQSLPRAAAVAG
jgi:hypothetical protein